MPSKWLGLTLDRIAEVDGEIHAFLYVDGERALASAARVDAKIAAGEPVGPLAGVPLALKDILDLYRRTDNLWLEDLGRLAPAIRRDSDPAASRS